MTNFKTGDKVKITKGELKGSTGKITEYRGPKSLWPWKVVYDSRNHAVPSGIYSDSELELVPTNKFKVGDWVEITGWHGGYEGQVKQIASVPYPGYIYYSFVDKSGGFSDKYLKAAKAPAKFKVGDWVKVSNRKDSWDGTVGTVQKINDDCGYGVCYTIHKNNVGDTYKQSVSKNVLHFFEDNLVAHTPALFSEGGYVPTVKAKFDNVDGPAHYGGTDNPFEVIKVAEAWGFEKNAYLFNALKYLARAGKKGSKVEDLKKLQYYVAREIALEEAKK